jgi:hypothetical protein
MAPQRITLKESHKISAADNADYFGVVQHKFFPVGQ